MFGFFNKFGKQILLDFSEFKTLWVVIQETYLQVMKETILKQPVEIFRIEN